MEKSNERACIVVGRQEYLVKFIDLELHEIEIVVVAEDVSSFDQELPVASLVDSSLFLGISQNFLHAVVVFGLQAESCLGCQFQNVLDSLDDCLEEVVLVVAH